VSGLENSLLTWLPIIFFGVVIVLLLYTMRFMPRAKPAPVVKGSQVDVSWGDVAGLDEAKEELREVVDFLKDRKRFERLGARVPRGILLHGPPGTGKTLLAKAVASASGANFYSQSASSFVEMFAGLGAARIRKLFEEARKNAPAIVFIDELDAVGSARGGGSGLHREHDQTLNQLLVELDGFSHRDEVVVMAASNRLQDLDPALLRPGRFDRQVLVAPPDVSGRESILGVHTRDSRSPRTSTSARSRGRPRASPAPISRTSATRPRSSRGASGLSTSGTPISTPRWSGSSPGSSSAASSRRRRSGSSLTTRPATRSCPTWSESYSPPTRRPSSRADRPSATP